MGLAFALTPVKAAQKKEGPNFLFGPSHCDLEDCLKLGAGSDPVWEDWEQGDSRGFASSGPGQHLMECILGGHPWTQAFPDINNR